MTSSILPRLVEQFPELHWQEQADLASHTYMRVGGPAEVLLVIDNLDQMIEVILFARQENIKTLILGGTSNLVIRDGGVDGLVIINRCSNGEHYMNKAEVQSDLALDDSYFEHVPSSAQFLLAESGAPTAMVVDQAIKQNLTGLEPFVGVPGTLGGAVYNNSHYQTELIGDLVAAVEVLTPEGERRWIHQAESEFAYDDSRFQRSGEIILQVLLFVLPGDPDKITLMVQESDMKRSSTQPLGTPSSGCVFKNVELTPEQSAKFDGKTNLSAGWLIDQAGLKGAKVGGAEVSSVHANFIVNTGSATSQDIEQLIAKIQTTVKDKFQIELDKEVFFLGKEQN